MKVYPSSAIIEALKEEDCPSNLNDMDALWDLSRDRESQEPNPRLNYDDQDRPTNEFNDHSLNHPNRKSGIANGEHPQNIVARSHGSRHHVDVFDDSETSQNFDQYADESVQSRRLGHGHHSDKLARSNRHDERFPEDDRNERHSTGDLEANQSDLPSLHQWSRSELAESDLLKQATVNYKRVPRRGDIGIQVIDERGN